MAPGFDILTNGFSEFSSVWYLAGLVITGYLSYYLSEVVKQPRLVCSPCKFREFLENNLPIIQEKFYPTVWCYESRAQTVIASFVRSAILPTVDYRREVLTLQDGGEVALDWKEENAAPDSPVIIILPGLTGSSQTEYVKGLTFSASKMGVRVVVFNNRGLGGMKLKTSRTYCAANFEDVSEVIRHVKKSHPHVPLGAIGISMGGLILGNYLSNQQEESSKMLNAAMLISAPWNVFVGTESIEKPVLNYLLNRHLAFCLRKTIHERREMLEPHMDYNLVMGSKTIREFDSNFTTKQFGYKDVLDYYAHASIHNKIHLIRVPTLCLSAADDPMQPIEGIPIEAANKSEHVAILIPTRGGHIGFMEGVLPVSYDDFMTRCFSQFFSAIFRDGNYKEFSKGVE